MLFLFFVAVAQSVVPLLLISCTEKPKKPKQHKRRQGSDDSSSKTSLSRRVPSEVVVLPKAPPPKPVPPHVPQTEPVPTTETKTEPPTALDKSMRVECTQVLSSKLSTESLKPMAGIGNDDTKDDTESLKPYKLDVPSEVLLKGNLLQRGKDSVYLTQKPSENRMKEDVTLDSERTIKETRAGPKIMNAAKVRELQRKVSREVTTTAKEKVKSEKKKESRIKGKKAKKTSKNTTDEVTTAREKAR